MYAKERQNLFALEFKTKGRLWTGLENLALGGHLTITYVHIHEDEISRNYEIKHNDPLFEEAKQMLDINSDPNKTTPV